MRRRRARPPIPTHGRCRPCGVVYRWQASNGRRLRDARCPVHGEALDQTCLGLMKDPVVVDREPLFGDPVKPTQEQLEAAFDLVKNPSDWKDEIDATIPAEKRDLVADAVVHFTATLAHFEPAGEGRLRVRATGYRMGPAGDH